MRYNWMLVHTLGVLQIKTWINNHNNRVDVTELLNDLLLEEVNREEED